VLDALYPLQDKYDCPSPHEENRAEQKAASDHSEG
jgi:hypothetical protein